MTDSPDTVTSALALLAQQGYTEDFNLHASATTCPRCGQPHDFTNGMVEQQFRFEGDSDPGDEAIVFGIVCPTCGARGVLVSAFGPGAEMDLPSLTDNGAVTATGDVPSD